MIMCCFVNKFLPYVLFKNYGTKSYISSTSALTSRNQGKMQFCRCFSVYKKQLSYTFVLKNSHIKLNLNTCVERQIVQSINDFWMRRKNLNQCKYDLVQPGIVSPSRSMPSNLPLPEYAESGVVGNSPSEIEIKNSHQIELLRKSCKLASKILKGVKEVVQVGVTTDDIDKFVHETSIQHGAYPSPLNYRGFPKSVCTSVNNVACHGIPDDRPLKLGDLISIDISVFKNGYHGDCAATYEVGTVDKEGKKLIEVAKTCLVEAINICHPGQRFSAIGEIVSDIADAAGFSVVPAFCGHGIGTYFHGPPQILHYRNNMEEIMEPGMAFTIEPVICEGKPDIVVLEDGWTAMTVDNSRCAQFEHTVLITECGTEILTS